MRVFVTGGAGYIGSATVRMLLAEEHEVTIFDNLEYGHIETVSKNCRFIKGDLRNEDEICDAMCRTKPDAVIHFAAFAYVGESMRNPIKYFENNVGGGINLLKAVVKNEVKKIIFSSTCAIYGQPSTLPINEDTRQHPENPYGESKLIFEKMLFWIQKIYKIDTVCLRYFNACGAIDNLGEDHDPETHLIPLVLDAAREKRESITIFGDNYQTADGSCIRDYVHIKDLATAHVLALASGISGSFNLGSGKGHSVKEVIETVKKVTGKKFRVDIDARRDGDPPELIASTEKANRILGWTSTHSNLEMIIQDAWEWVLNHPKGYGI